MNENIYVVIGIMFFIFVIACLFMIYPSKEKPRSWIDALVFSLSTSFMITIVGLFTIRIARSTEQRGWIPLVFGSLGVGAICLLGYGWLLDFLRLDSNKQNTDNSTQRKIDR